MYFLLSFHDVLMQLLGLAGARSEGSSAWLICLVFRALLVLGLVHSPRRPLSPFSPLCPVAPTSPLGPVSPFAPTVPWIP